MFRRSLSALSGRRRGQTALGGRHILVPPKPVYPLHRGAVSPLGSPLYRRRTTAADRRRRNLTYLAVFIIATFLLGIVPALRFLLVLNLIADVLLILYLGLAVYMTAWPPEKDRAPVHPAAEPGLAPQRVAEGGL